jgi:hypothetical protein
MGESGVTAGETAQVYTKGPVMETTEIMRHDAKLRNAEQRIQRILLNLEEETGREVDNVRVDTRRFANLKPEIFLR